MTAASAPWQTPLADGAVRTIDAAPLKRFVRVERGELWLTRMRADIDEFADHWLQAGDAIELPTGSAWLLEARGDANYVLIEAAVAQGSQPAWLGQINRVSAWLHAAWASPRAVLA
jgi:Protein of unknown function (DUF2917)